MNKDELEKQHSQQMNKEKIEHMKGGAEQKGVAISNEEADRIESIFFEDDEKVTLRDGKTYAIPALFLVDARRFMKLIKTVNVDAIILNFIPTEDPVADKQREEDLFDMLLMAFKGYPHVDRDYLDEYVDLNTCRKIIEIMIGMNGLKK